MAAKKTRFGNEDLLGAMLESTNPAPEPPAERKADSKPAPSRKTASKPRQARAKQAGSEPEKQNLNVEIDKEVFIAMNIRRSVSKTRKLGTDDSFIKIVDNALRSYLKNEMSIATDIDDGV